MKTKANSLARSILGRGAIKEEVDEIVATLRALQDLGWTTNELQDIRSSKSVLAPGLRKLFCNHCLFTPADKQKKLLQAINQEVWKDPAFTEKEEKIWYFRDPPEYPSSDRTGLYCATLIYYTGKPAVDFWRYWEAFCHIHRGKPRPDRFYLHWDSYMNNQANPQGIRLRPGARKRLKGFYWVVAELGRVHREKGVWEVRQEFIGQQVRGIGPELFAFAVMHPKWAINIDGDHVPYPIATDIEIAELSAFGVCRRYLGLPYFYHSGADRDSHGEFHGEFNIGICKIDERQSHSSSGVGFILEVVPADKQS